MGARVGDRGAGLMPAAHLEVPLRRDGDRLATVPQDSSAEVEQNIGAILRTRVGHRTDLPDFGYRPPAFSRGGVDVDEIERAIGEWEDRADVAAMRDEGVLERVALAQGLDVVRIDPES